MKVVLRSRRVKAIDGLLVARTRGFRAGSNRRIDAIMIPRDVESLLAWLALKLKSVLQKQGLNFDEQIGGGH